MFLFHGETSQRMPTRLEHSQTADLQTDLTSQNRPNKMSALSKQLTDWLGVEEFQERRSTDGLAVFVEQAGVFWARLPRHVEVLAGPQRP